MSVKIVHVHHSLMPGMGYQENQLPAEIAKLGYDIEIVTSSFPPAQFSDQEDGFEPGLYEYNGVKTHRLPTRFRLESIGQGFLKGLEKKLRDIDPDIIQGRSLLTTQTPRLARFAANNDVCLMIDEHVDNDNFNIESSSVMFAYEIYKCTVARYVIEQCDLFLPVQPFSKLFLQEEFGISSEQMELLPLGVNKNTFYNDSGAREKIRDELCIDQDETLIISAGNFDPRKDINTLIDAIAKFDDNINLKLILVGRPSGPEGKKYYKMVSEKVSNKGLENRVWFKEFVPRNKLNEYYNAADIGVWPGKLGITTAEAVGSGLPVIVCESAATEYLISNNNGFAFERGNADELYELLYRYVSNTSLVMEHSERSIEASREDLSWTAIAKKNVHLYEDFVK